MSKKTFENAKTQLTAITRKSYDEVTSWDELTKAIRFECVCAANTVERLETLHNQIIDADNQIAPE